MAIRLARVARGWSQVRLGEISGVPQTQISLIERGLSPSKVERDALAQAFAGDENEGAA
jgi:transcriptional regulator with XRE-family HTH domain